MFRRVENWIANSLLGMLAVITLAAIGGCGRQQSNTPTIAPQQVSVSPATAQIVAGSSYQFAVTVVPANAATTVQWSVSGLGCSGAACGSVNSAGEYSAPPSPPSPSIVTLTATSILDQTKLGEATVSIISSQLSNDFHTIGNMTVPRAGATATLLQDGRVLIAGGEQSGPFAELYNPAAGTFQASNASLSGTPNSLPEGGNVNITGTPLLLNNGQVLFVEQGTAELYDPKTDSTTPTGHLLVNQNVLAATLLASGKALVLGDHDSEIYDPASGSFSFAGPYAGSLGDTRAVRLPDDRVLILGGSPSQLFDPTTNSFSSTSTWSGTSLDGVDSLYSATSLQDGRVLVAGGVGAATTHAAAIYDPANGKFTTTGAMNDARDAHAAVPLLNGRVLVLGGDGWSCSGSGDFCYFSGSLSSAELYEPATGIFNRAGNMNQARTGPTATLLQNGDVLIAGGYVYCGIACLLGPTASAEIYHPE